MAVSGIELGPALFLWADQGGETIREFRDPWPYS